MSKSQLAGADGLSGAAPAPGTDINSLSQSQFGAELAWLKAQGYHSVTAAQYLSWDTGKAVTLPSKPILITVDDGIEDFYADGTSVLQKYGFTAVAFVVTQFADGATAGTQPSVGWDATAYEQALRDEFDQLSEEGRHRRRMMVISMHDRISGHANRVRSLDRLLTYARSKPEVSNPAFAHTRTS